MTSQKLNTHKTEFICCYTHIKIVTNTKVDAGVNFTYFTQNFMMNFLLYSNWHCVCEIYFTFCVFYS